LIFLFCFDLVFVLLIHSSQLFKERIEE